MPRPSLFGSVQSEIVRGSATFHMPVLVTLGGVLAKYGANGLKDDHSIICKFSISQVYEHMDGTGEIPNAVVARAPAKTPI